MMTKEEILHTFKDINVAYNNCMMYDTLERMLTELCEEMMPKTKVLALLDRIDNDVYEGLGYDHEKWVNEVKNEALEMAIESLSAEPCEDCISREPFTDSTICEGFSCNECSFNRKNEGGCILEERVKALPPVTQKQKMGRWIPVSEKLPNDRDWYLGIFKEPDTGWINPIPFICDYVGRETKATTKEYWILHGFTDWDERIDYYFNLECVAWMPLPEPYKAESEDKE